MEFRKERVVLETERHRILGDLNLPREGYLSRLSDFLNRGELKFVSLTDVTVTEFDEVGEPEITEHPFLAVGSDHVQLAYLAGEED